jgi:hypothetical protein
MTIAIMVALALVMILAAPTTSTETIGLTTAAQNALAGALGK